MDGKQQALQRDAVPAMGQMASEDFATRLATRPSSRLGETVGALVANLNRLADELKLTPSEFHAATDFLTEVGHYADTRRQEWVLLADVLGLSSHIEDLNNRRPVGATPNTVAGPFYRADVPDMPAGANISRDGKGEPLTVSGRVLGLSGEPVSGAVVEVWQANAEGKYENQEPDRQPEHNLRGRFVTDARGGFTFTTVMPRGYALPSDGPVGRLMKRLGLELERPAHLHFRVTAEGYETLTTHIFDHSDPAVGRDAIFGVKPELLARFRADSPDGKSQNLALYQELVLCPQRQDRLNERRKP